MSGSAVGFVAAFGAGVASFASPCILPLVPAYLATVAGLGADRLHVSDDEGQRPWGALSSTVLFVAGFTVVFVMLGMSASGLGRELSRHQAVLTRVSGVFMVAVAIYLAGTLVLRTPSLYGEYRFHPRLRSFGPFAAPVAGAAFAFGWTPCVGPVLASVLAVAAQQGQVWHGAWLLLAYSAGLGLPFVVTAVAFDRVRGIFAWLRSHASMVTVVSAVALGGFGVLLVLDRLAWVTTQVQRIA
jgi:cytochrome c-type biogenesis protein